MTQYDVGWHGVLKKPMGWASAIAEVLGKRCGEKSIQNFVLDKRLVRWRSISVLLKKIRLFTKENRLSDSDGP